MKQILFIFMAVVLAGCGTTSWTSDPDNPQNVSIEQAIRKNLKKPEGKLTSEDLAKVSFIDLRGHREITDVGLKEVAKLPKLKRLRLDGTSITDAGLKEMAKLKQLKDIYLEGTKVTEVGVTQLGKALPNCTIWH